MAKEVEELNKQNIGVRYNEGKLRFDLIPHELLEETAKVLTFGMTKYAEENWKHFNEKQRKEVYGSLLRHIYAWKNGEILDQESNFNHLAHAACNIAFLLWFEKNPIKENKSEETNTKNDQFLHTITPTQCFKFNKENTDLNKETFKFEKQEEKEVTTISKNDNEIADHIMPKTVENVDIETLERVISDTGLVCYKKKSN